MTSAEVLAILRVSDRPMMVNEIVEEMGWEITVANRKKIRASLNHLCCMGRVERRGKALGRRQSWNTLWEAVA